MNNRDINIIKETVKRGYKIKIIDISNNGSIEEIRGVEKVYYRGEVK